MSWVKAAHVFGVGLWAGGLLALTRLLSAGARGAESGRAPIAELARRLYFRSTAPGAALALFTGIWMLHAQPSLLKQPFMHVKLTCVLLLFAADHVCMRGARGLDRPGKAARPLLFSVAAVASTLLVAAIVTLIVVKPWLKG